MTDQISPIGGTTLSVPLLQQNKKGNTNSKSKEVHYNPFCVPPDILLAQKHGIAKRVSEYQDLADPNIEKCICCGRAINNELLPLCCDSKSLYHLGVCFPLYYHYLKYCFIIILVMLGISGIFNLLSNLEAEDTSLGFIINASIVGNTSMSIDTQSILNLITIGVTIITFHFFREQQSSIAKECDSDSITPSDYTLMISNLDGLTFTEEEIKDFIEDKFPKTESNEPKVARVLLTYDIKELTEIVSKRDETLLRIRTIMDNLHDLKHKKEMNEEERHKAIQDEQTNLTEAKNELKKIEETLIVLEQKYRARSYPLTGVVFVSFTYESYAQEFKRKCEVMWYHKLCSSQNYANRKFKGRFFDVEVAPEPTDVLWENLAFGGSKLAWRRFITRAATAFVIIIGFGIICIMDVLGIVEEQSMVFSMMVSMVVVIVNSFLSWCIRKFAVEERQNTFTDYHCSVAEKLSWAQFINTCFVIVVVQFVGRRWLPSNTTTTTTNTDSSCNTTQLDTMLQNIVYQMFFIFITNAICPALFTILDPFYFLKLYTRKQIEKQGEECTYTQAQANAIYEGIEVDMSQRYANVIKSMFLTAFCAPFTPLGIPLSLASVVFVFWTDKYMLLRMHSTPNEMGKKLSEKMTEYIELFPFFFALGNLLIGVYYHLIDCDHTLQGRRTIILSIIGLILSLLHLLIPLKLIRKYIKSKLSKLTRKGSLAENMSYDEAYMHFQIDYERANPITHQEAQERFLKKQLEDQDDEEKTKKIREELEKIKKQKENQNKELKDNFVFKYAMVRPTIKDQYNNLYGGAGKTPGLNADNSAVYQNKEFDNILQPLNVKQYIKGYANFLKLDISKGKSNENKDKNQANNKNQSTPSNLLGKAKFDSLSISTK